MCLVYSSDSKLFCKPKIFMKNFLVSVKSKKLFIFVNLSIDSFKQECASHFYNENKQFKKQNMNK